MNNESSILPPYQFILNLRQQMRIEDGVLDASPLLTAIIIEEAEGIVAEGYDGYEVAAREQRHAKVA